MKMLRVGAAALSLCLFLAGCSVSSGDTERLLRVPQHSGQGSELQKALNSYLGSGVDATLRYPASGEFLSPFLFGDWDGDGTEEAAVLYTAEPSGTNVWIAVLEPDGEDGWQVAQTAEGLSGEVESVTTAHLRDETSTQIIAGYGSSHGDRYLVVYLYSDGVLQPIIKRTYTQMILADVTGKSDTQELVLALPTEVENGGVNLDLLTYLDGEFRSAQTLAVGAGSYNGCAGLQAGQDGSGEPWLVVDGWVGTAQNSLASSIVRYDEATGFLQLYEPPGAGGIYRSTVRYSTSLLSRDIDGNGTIDIPTESDEGGTLVSPMDKRLRFLVWKDYAGENGHETFGVYDSEYRFFLPLPDSMKGRIQLRSNPAGTGWLVCNAEGTTIYFEVRVVTPAEEGQETGDYRRIANIGSQQLQMRIITPHYALSVERIISGLVLLD